MVEIYCYYHMRTDSAIRRTPRRPTISITRCGPAPRRCGRTTRIVHPRGWRAFMEYGNGIVGDMCVHMLDMTRWMMDLGWPKTHQLHRRHLRRQREQGEHLRHADGHVRLRRPAESSGSIAPGAIAPDPKYPWGATFTATKARSKPASWATISLPLRQGRSHPSRRHLRTGTISRRQNREGSGEALRPRHPRAT